MGERVDVVLRLDRLGALPPVCAFTGRPAETSARVKPQRTTGIVPLPGLIIRRYRQAAFSLPLTRRAKRLEHDLPRCCAWAVPVLAVGPALAVSALWGPAAGAGTEATIPTAGYVAMLLGLLAAGVAAGVYLRARRRITLLSGGAGVRIRRVDPAFGAAVASPPGMAPRSPGSVPGVVGPGGFSAGRRR